MMSVAAKSKISHIAARADEPQAEERRRLRYAGGEIGRALGFLLSLSMIGLNFPLGYLLVPIFLLSAFKADRYDFIIMVTILIGGYNLVSSADFFVIELANVGFGLGLLSMLVLRKPPIVKQVMIALGCYALALVLLAMQSDESLKVQALGLRNYLCFIYFFFPLVVFSGMEFDIMEFFKKIFLYCLCICSFYLIDSIMLGGALLLPRDSSLMTYDIVPTFYNLYIHPITGMFIRRWPLGLYPLALCMFPLVRYYKLTLVQWILIIGALVVCRTFTFTLALIVGAFVSIPDKRKLAKYLLTGVCVLTVLYFVDGTMGETYTSDDQGEHQQKHTTLRIKSQIDQLLFLDFATADEEDLAMLGTGRGAQIIPKLELVLRLGKQWTGLGFLQQSLTTNKKYIIDNQLYGNPEKADEVAIGVESAPFDIFITIGFIGLIVHTLFWVWLWFILRRLKYSRYYVSLIAVFAVVGVGAVSLYSPSILYLVALAAAAIILDQKRELPGFSLPGKIISDDSKSLQ